jgi:primosomal protein N' (replication factor Y) (superfamily II helicase)
MHQLKMAIDSPTQTPTHILQIAVPKPLHSHFDYLPPPKTDINQLRPGIRLRVPFGKTSTEIGILLAIVDKTDVPLEKLKAAKEILDSAPVLPENNLALLQWASRYYHYPIGDVISTALPAKLNKGQLATLSFLSGWKVTPEGQAIQLEELSKTAHKQKAILNLLQQHPEGLTQAAINTRLSNASTTLRTLEKKGLIVSQALIYKPSTDDTIHKTAPLSLNSAQQQVVNQVSNKLGQFYPCLLDGVTGSGKTEVYLHLIQKVITQGQQALVLVPEINLTPQTVNRFKQRFTVPIAVWHSKLNDTERLQTWLQARDGLASIIIGTRSAIWTPLAHPGLFIVDEEHDASYKQQDHFRYSARDMAVVRAQRAKVPILLGSATPSLDTLYNAQQQRYQHLILPERAGAAVHPTFHIVDMRQQQQRESLSHPLKKAINQRLAAHQQVLLFINRRGYAPTLTCYQCGWVAFCEHCDARLTYHESTKELQCHHCGEIRPPDKHCPKCQYPKLYLLGQGTERVEEQLQNEFKDARILRIDSDSTSRKEAMAKLLERIHQGEVDILVGTQMLAKGHHFPKVTLVGVLNIDGGLYGLDFRAPERMAQLLVQVAGRAGRADAPGEVIIQTYHPDHPLLTHLIRHGYGSFANAALKEREQAAFPPYSHLALLRAESLTPQNALAFLNTAKASTEISQNVQIWGPVPAPMEKRAKWYRAQLLLQSNQRDHLHQLLTQWLPKLPSPTNEVRWSLDVDPQDLF